MKGKIGKPYSLKRTPKTGITIYAVMGRLDTKPENIRTRRNSHGITTHITRKMKDGGKKK